MDSAPESIDHGRVSELFVASCDLEPDERAAFLESRCDGNRALREKVERLIQVDRAADGILSEEALQSGFSLRGDAGTEGAVDEPMPKRIGQYEIIGRIGAGGMGTVFEAQQENPHRRVAIKLLRSGAASRSVLRRFQLESEILGKLQHPGIVHVYEAGMHESDDDVRPFFTMELIHGEPLSRHVASRDLSTRQRLTLMTAICDAVHHAHLKGVVHRDLKPSNILVQEGEDGGQPRILDFGVARAIDAETALTTIQTNVGQLIGTVPYMSPEQIAGNAREIDTRSDVYALGVILFEVLTGRLPHDLDGRSIPEAVRIISEEDPTRLSRFDTTLRGDLETIVGKALEKEPVRRYASASALGGDIRRFLNNEPITARPVTTVYQLRKFARRNRSLVGGVIATILALIAGIIVSTQYGIGEGRQRREAGRNAYMLSITAASSLRDSNPAHALRQLEAAPVHLRNWEWRHLQQSLQPLVASHAGDRGQGTTFAINPEGRLIAATVRGGTIILADALTGKQVSVVEHEAPLSWPVLSTDASWLAALSVETGEVVMQRTDNDEQALVVSVTELNSARFAFNADGSMLCINGIAAASRGTRTSLVDTGTGETRLLPTFNETASETDAPRFAPDQSEVFIRSRTPFAPHRVEIVNLRTGERRSTPADMSAFGPAGEVAVQDPTTHVMHIQPLEALFDQYDASRAIETYRGMTTRGTAAFSPSGRSIACNSAGRTYIWQRPTGELLQVLNSGPGAVTFCPDESLIAIAGVDQVALWRWRDGSSRPLIGHTSYVYIATYSPDASTIASAGWDKTIRLWDALTGDLLATLPIPFDSVFGLGFSPDGANVIVRYTSNLTFDTATGQLVPEARFPKKDHSTHEDAARPTEDAMTHYLSSTQGGTKYIVKQRGQALAISYDRARVAIGAGGGQVTIESLPDRNELKRLVGHDSVVTSVAFSHDGSRLAAGAADGTITVWDLATETTLAVMTGHTRHVYSVNFSPDDSRLVSGSDDQLIMVWDMVKLAELIHFDDHDSYVYSVEFSPDGTQIVSASGDTTVRILDSIDTAERSKQARRSKALREDMRPIVEKLLGELPDAAAVAEHLRRDAMLDEDRRRAALRVLLSRATIIAK